MYTCDFCVILGGGAADKFSYPGKSEWHTHLLSKDHTELQKKSKGKFWDEKRTIIVSGCQGAKGGEMLEYFETFGDVQNFHYMSKRDGFAEYCKVMMDEVDAAKKIHKQGLHTVGRVTFEARLQNKPQVQQLQGPPQFSTQNAGASSSSATATTRPAPAPPPKSLLSTLKPNTTPAAPVSASGSTPFQQLVEKGEGGFRKGVGYVCTLCDRNVGKGEEQWVQHLISDDHKCIHQANQRYYKILWDLDRTVMITRAKGLMAGYVLRYTIAFGGLVNDFSYLSKKDGGTDCCHVLMGTKDAAKKLVDSYGLHEIGPQRQQVKMSFIQDDLKVKYRKWRAKLLGGAASVGPGPDDESDSDVIVIDDSDNVTKTAQLPTTSSCSSSKSAVQPPLKSPTKPPAKTNTPSKPIDNEKTGNKQSSIPKAASDAANNNDSPSKGSVGRSAASDFFEADVGSTVSNRTLNTVRTETEEDEGDRNENDTDDEGEEDISKDEDTTGKDCTITLNPGLFDYFCGSFPGSRELKYRKVQLLLLQQLLEFNHDFWTNCLGLSFLPKIGQKYWGDEFAKIHAQGKMRLNKTVTQKVMGIMENEKQIDLSFRVQSKDQLIHKIFLDPLEELRFANWAAGKSLTEFSLLLYEEVEEERIRKIKNSAFESYGAHDPVQFDCRLIGEISTTFMKITPLVTLTMTVDTKQYGKGGINLARMDLIKAIYRKLAMSYIQKMLKRWLYESQDFDKEKMDRIVKDRHSKFNKKHNKKLKQMAKQKHKNASNQSQSGNSSYQKKNADPKQPVPQNAQRPTGIQQRLTGPLLSSPNVAPLTQNQNQWGFQGGRVMYRPRLLPTTMGRFPTPENHTQLPPFPLSGGGDLRHENMSFERISRDPNRPLPLSQQNNDRQQELNYGNAIHNQNHAINRMPTAQVFAPDPRRELEFDRRPVPSNPPCSDPRTQHNFRIPEPSQPLLRHPYSSESQPSQPLLRNPYSSESQPSQPLLRNPYSSESQPSQPLLRNPYSSKSEPVPPLQDRRDPRQYFNIMDPRTNQSQMRSMNSGSTMEPYRDGTSSSYTTVSNPQFERRRPDPDNYQGTGLAGRGRGILKPPIQPTRYFNALPTDDSERRRMTEFENSFTRPDRSSSYNYNRDPPSSSFGVRQPSIDLQDSYERPSRLSRDPLRPYDDPRSEMPYGPGGAGVGRGRGRPTPQPMKRALFVPAGHSGYNDQEDDDEDELRIVYDEDPRSLSSPPPPPLKRFKVGAPFPVPSKSSDSTRVQSPVSSVSRNSMGYVTTNERPGYRTAPSPAVSGYSNRSSSPNNANSNSMPREGLFIPQSTFQGFGINPIGGRQAAVYSSYGYNRN